MGFLSKICNKVSNIVSSPLGQIAAACVPGLGQAVQVIQAADAARKTLKALKQGGLPALMQQAMQAGIDRAVGNLVPREALHEVARQVDEAVTDRIALAMRKAVDAARAEGQPWHSALAAALPHLGVPEVEDELRKAIAERLDPAVQRLDLPRAA